MKKIILFLLLALALLIIFYPTNDKDFKKIKGEWQIIQFNRHGNDSDKEDYKILCFDDPDSFWVSRLDGKNEFVLGDYDFVKNPDTIKIDVTKCRDRRFEGKYDVYIDTIQDTGESYIIQLSLDSEDTYIEAIRSKLKNQ